MVRALSGLGFSLFVTSIALAADPPSGFVACSKAVRGDTTVMQMPVDGGQIKLSGNAASLEMKNAQRCSSYLESDDWKCQICKDKGKKQSRGWVSSYSFRTSNALDVFPFSPDEKARIDVGDNNEAQVLYSLHTKPGQEGMSFNLACTMTGKGTTAQELESKVARGLCSALKEMGIDLLLRPMPEDSNVPPVTGNASRRNKQAAPQ